MTSGEGGGQLVEMVERNWNGRRRGRRSTQAGMMCDGLSRDRDGRAIFTGRGRVGTGARHITTAPRVPLK